MSEQIKKENNTIAPEISEVIDNMTRYIYDAYQIMQAYEGVPDLDPAILRHAKKCFLDLNKNQVNLIANLQMQYGNMMHKLGLDKQNTDKFNQEKMLLLLAMNQLSSQSLILQQLALIENLMESQKNQLNHSPKPSYHPAPQKTPEDFFEKHTEELEHFIQNAKTAPYPHPFPHSVFPEED